MVADEEEVVRALWYPTKVGVAGLCDVEMKDVTEDFWGYACDVQQRVSGPFESDNFCVRGEDGVVIDLAAHPGNLNALRQVSRTRRNELTHANSSACVFFERQAVHRGREKSWRLAIDADHHGNSTRYRAFGFRPTKGLIGVSNVHVHRSSMTPIETYITVVLDDWAKSQNPCPTREDRPVGNDWR